MRRTVLALAAACAACAPALREPPSVAILASKPVPAELLDADTIRYEAAARWARRPDIAAVREAEALYLQAAHADEADVTALIGATRAKTWLVDHEPDAKRRAELAVSAVQTAQWCGRRRPDDPACDYWLALAVGVQAREVRSTVDDGLKTMIAALQRAIDRDPAYDDAGPERVMALVLLRAPGWPLGPGDFEEGLAHARRAFALRPDHPANMLALAEALAANKQRGPARDAYRSARAAAVRRKDAGDPDAGDWIRDADAALSSLKP